MTGQRGTKRESQGGDQAAEGRFLVAIGVPTCNRPGGLRLSLESLLELKAPEGADLIFLVIDNGDVSMGSEATVAEFASKTKWPVRYVHEPTRGIPYARNRILETALEADARYLLGLDDDELAPPDWATTMVSELQTQNLTLIGGPMRRIAEPGLDLTPTQKWMLDAIVEHAHEEAERQKRRARKPEPMRTIYTGNYGLDLDFVRATDIRYDPKFALTGGEDSDFAKRLVDLGGKTGWAETAYMTEIMPAARLSPGYVVRRNRDFAPNWVRIKRPGRWPFVLGALEEAFDLVIYAIPALFGGPRWKFFYLQRYGRFLGHTRAALGRRKWHYAPDQEHLR